MEELLLNITFSVLFISIFIVVFFFSYASMMEKYVIEAQTQQVVDYFFDDFVILLQNEQIKQLSKQMLANLDAYTVEDDERIQSKNNDIINQTLMLITIFATILLLFIIFVFVKNCNKINLQKIFIKNVILLLVVALTEFLFTTFIASKYISFDPNYIKYTLTDAMKEFAQET
jgi:hypothetical protein|tara:strand:- start:697 stop:1215 length:519 start_codon:yes stop_codon:yes gene_type:complete